MLGEEVLVLLVGRAAVPSHESIHLDAALLEINLVGKVSEGFEESRRKLIKSVELIQGVAAKR